MHRTFMVSFIAIAAAFSMGCAAQSKCLRDVSELQATAHRQDQEIADLNGRLAVVRAEQAGTTVGSLASEVGSAALSAWNWAVGETPIVGRKVEATYNSASERMDRARQCYRDHGGEQAHTYEEYKGIATACLNSN